MITNWIKNTLILLDLNFTNLKILEFEIDLESLNLLIFMILSGIILILIIKKIRKKITLI